MTSKRSSEEVGRGKAVDKHQKGLRLEVGAVLTVLKFRLPGGIISNRVCGNATKYAYEYIAAE